MRIPPQKLVLILLVAAAAVIGTAGAYTLYANWYVLDVQEVPVRYQVNSALTVGFALDKDALAFGRIPAGGTAERGATIESYVPSRAVITANDDLAGVLMPAENDILLEPGVPHQVKFLLTVPKDQPDGNYTGTVRITYFRRP